MTKRIANLTCPASGLQWKCVADDLATPKLAYHPAYSSLGISQANLAHTASAAAASAVLHWLGYATDRTTHTSTATLTEAQVKFLNELEHWSKGMVKWSGEACPTIFLNTIMGKSPGHAVSRNTFSMRDAKARVNGLVDPIEQAKKQIVKENNLKLLHAIPLFNIYATLDVTVQNKLRHGLFLHGFDAAARELERRRIITQQDITLFNQLDLSDME